MRYLTGERRRLRRGMRAFVREIELDDVRVFVDHGFQWDGSANVWLTRARASYLMQAGPAFEVRPRGTLGRLLGFHGGVGSGDPCFDYFFSVRTAQPAETWQALTTRARSLLAGEFEDAHLESDGHMITLWREGDFGREADAAAAIEIVHELARHRSGALDPLRRLPGARYRPATGPWDHRQPPAVELAATASVTIAPAAFRGRPVTTIRARCGRATPSFGLGHDAAALADPAVPRGLVDGALELGASGLDCDGRHVTLRLPDLETRREVLVAAAEFVASVASTGVYR